MPEQDGAVFGSPACGDHTPDPRAGAGGLPPRPRWCSSAGPSAGSPTAAPPTDSAVGERRRRGRAGPGVQLCTLRLRTLRRRLVGGGDPIWLSDHNGAAVQVVRADTSRQLKVRAFSGGGASDGMEPGENVQIAGWTRGCNALDRLGTGPPDRRQNAHSAAILRAATRPWLAFDPAPEGFPCGFLLLW